MKFPKRQVLGVFVWGRFVYMVTFPTFPRKNPFVWEKVFPVLQLYGGIFEKMYGGKLAKSRKSLSQ